MLRPLAIDADTPGGDAPADGPSTGIRFVQAAGNGLTSGSLANSATFTNPVAQGSLIIVQVDFDPSTRTLTSAG